MIETIKNNIKKIAVGGTVSLTAVLGFMWTEINSAESKADTANIIAAQNQATLTQAVKTIDLLLQLEMVKQGLTPETVFVPIDTISVDTADSN